MKNNKKGFTLAELLIVVAIIAVLVAIAVPLFVGALTKAQEASEDANVRSLRGYGVAYILMMEEDDKYYSVCYTDGKLNTPEKGFQLQATWNEENSAFENLVITTVSDTGKNEVSGGNVYAVVTPSSFRTDKGE